MGAIYAAAVGTRIATPSAAQLAGGRRTDGGGAWRPYADRLAEPFAPLAPWLSRFGYPGS